MSRVRRAVLAVLALAASTCSPAARVADVPTIVLVIVDTLRADHLGCYGYPRSPAPTMCALAEDATLFERAYTPRTATTPAIASVLTGLYPHRHGVRELYQVLPDRMTTLAERLRDAGYRTGGFVSSFVMVRDFSGFAQGFEVYDDVMTERELNRENFERDASLTIDRAVGWLSATDRAPVFLMVHLIEPHGPYTPPQPFRDRMALAPAPPPVPSMPAYQKLPGLQYVTEYVGRYDGEIAAADHHLERLLEALRRAGRYDGATIVVTADHGESIGEEGRWFSHSKSVSDAEAHVPLLVKFGGPAGESLAGRRSSEPVSLVDLFTTILAEAGVEASEVGSSLGERGADLRDIAAGARRPAPPLTELVEQKGLTLSVHGTECQGRWTLPRAALTSASVLSEPARASDWRSLAAPAERIMRRQDTGCVEDLAATADPSVRDLLTYERDFPVAHRVEVSRPGYRAEFVRHQTDPLVPLTAEDAEKLHALGYAESSE